MPNTAEFMLNRLADWGVKRIYGYPGDGINGLLGAFHEVGDRVEFTQTAHEEIAAFAACAHAKFTGEVGVCMATSGPGAIHLLNGLYDAKLDHAPVVAIVGQQKRMSLGGHYQQEVDLQTLFKDVAADYVHYCMSPVQMRHLIDRAIRIAKAERTVTCIIIPGDVQEMDAVPSPPRVHGSVMSSVGYVEPKVVPHEADLRRAADVLNAGERVAMLIGQGARGAADEVVQVADVLGAGVAKALLGKDALPDDLPFVTGANGLLGTRPTYELMRDCDTLLMIGSSFPYSQFLPDYDQARAVQIDIDPTMIGLRYPFEVNLHGDARATLQALLPMLQRKSDRAWRERIEGNVADWWDVLERRAGVQADPINPQLVFHELSPLLPDNAMITADSGSAANWYARYLKFRGGMRGTLSGTLATMGPGMPYATGAKFAHPDRPVFALVGDGAMQMNGINELITAGKYYREWADPRLIVGVLNNGDLNQVTWELRAMSGAPQFEPSQRIPDFPYAELAESMGLRGIKITEPDAVRGAWEQALAADRPCLLEFVTDPAIPPIPPHATFDQMEKTAEALVKGDPEAWSVVKEGIKEKAQEFIPGRSGS